jgi:hypothetical protein
MRKIIFIAVLLFVQICFANNDKQILRNQTSRLLSRRQYERVITLYKDWLKDYPNDIEIAGKLVDTYLIVNKIDLAEELYNRYKDSFPAEGKLKFQLLIDLRKGEHKLAFRRVNKFLTVDTPEQEYLALAQLFQENRQYDFAAKLILAAREKSGDNTLYARELALNYYSAEEYEKSIREFFVMLENDERYYYFATSRIRQMLEKDKNLIKVVEKCVYRSNSNKAKEILADSFAELGMYEEAIEQYKNLELKKLLIFAKNLSAKQKYDAAILAFLSFMERSPNARSDAEAKMEIVKIEMKLNHLESAKKYLLQIYNDEKLASKRFARSTRANYQAREFLSEIALRENKDVSVAIKYLEEAKKYALNQRIKNSLNLKIAKIELMQSDFESVNEIIAQIRASGDEKNEVLQILYLKSLLSSSAEADSLLGEIMINSSSDNFTNDALTLKFLSEQFTGENKSIFWKAYQAYSLYKIEEAILLLDKLYISSKNEQVLLLAGDWLLQNMEFEKAKHFFSGEFEDDTAAEYAMMRLAELKNDTELVRNLLQRNSDSVFSAKLRLLLQ